MSELNNRDRNAYSKFEHMSTEDLETILRLDYQLPEGEGLDPDTILAITEVIANREESDSAPQYPDTDTAWNDFLTKYGKAFELSFNEDRQVVLTALEASL